MINNPKDRLYTDEHEWIKIDVEEGVVGITHHAQASLGDVVYVEMPDEGSSIIKGESIGVVESVKAVSDIYAPLSGVVLKVNENLKDSPEVINQDPYGEGWLIKISIDNPNEINKLLNPLNYDELLRKEAKV